MYKSRSYKEILREQAGKKTGLTRGGAGKSRAQARLQKQAIGNARYNKRQLPSGANRKSGVIIGGTRGKM